VARPPADHPRRPTPSIPARSCTRSRSGPLDTGVLQATALAATGLEAEVLAKAALLAGPERAARTLAHGGVVVLAGGIVEIVPPVA
jgi:hypothetical protein